MLRNLIKLKIQAKSFLYQKLKEDHESMIGPINNDFLNTVVNDWMNDENNSAHRYETIKKYFPRAQKIMDMAAGCGTFVFYGLKNGYDVEGVEPELWKIKFNQMKTEENLYPPDWNNKIIVAYGEHLPYQDEYFDVTSTYQTLEHVKDVYKCLEELLRVTKKGGGVHIICPDYKGTYEGHYRLPWLPLFPRILAKKYIEVLGRKSNFIDTINYTTTSMIKKSLLNIAQKKSYKIIVIDVNKEKFYEALSKKNLKKLFFLYPVYQVVVYLSKLFSSEIQTNIIVLKQ